MTGGGVFGFQPGRSSGVVDTTNISSILLTILNGTPWQAPVLESGWKEFTSVAFRKINNIVYFRGGMTGGVSGKLFILPEGFRPVQEAVFNPAGGEVGFSESLLVIRPTGVVELLIPAVHSSAEFIDGIFFFTV